MAIEFARVQIIHAGSGSAVGKSAYIERGKMRDELKGQSYDFHHHGELIDSGIVLPKSAPEWAMNSEQLWNEAQKAELVKDRKTGKLRFSKHGQPQVAKDVSLALPRELNDEQNRELLHGFIEKQFGQDVAVQWAIHKDKNNHNPHAHLLVSTRELKVDGFGKKVRDHNPTFFSGRILPDQFAKQWADFQNEFFKERGMDFRVDPTRIVPDRHMGDARFVENSEREGQREALAEQAREAALDPQKLIEKATYHQATFSEGDLKYHMKKAGLEDREQADVLEQIREYEGLVPLGEDRFTTKAIIQQEKNVVAFAEALSSASRFWINEVSKLDALDTRHLSSEQEKAFEFATGKEGLAVIQGRAGTGKSYTMSAIKDAYEYDGYRVIGLAPTNTVAADMRQNGFTEGRTLASEMMRLEFGQKAWDNRTVVIVDEMAMLSTRDMERLLATADKAGAKVIGFGDDRQLQSVERGGMFSYVAEKAVGSELKDVRRQNVDWQKEASEKASQGQIREAVLSYSAHDAVKWSDNLDSATSNLVEDWTDIAKRGEALPFVYAATNKSVSSLNDELHSALKDMGKIGAEEHQFIVEKGENKREVNVSVGDRIQFARTDKDFETGLDLRNGEFGEITRIDKNGSMAVKTDAGREFSFNAAEHNGWDLGYSATIYKGQGKSQDMVWALHDSKFAWQSNSAYVALTRHKDDFRLYANHEFTKSEQVLARNLERNTQDAPALTYLKEREENSVASKLDALRNKPRDLEQEREDKQRQRERSRGIDLGR